MYTQLFICSKRTLAAHQSPTLGTERNIANSYSTTLDGTRCFTHHDRATLIWGGGIFFQNVTIDKQDFFTLQTAPGYTFFTAYFATVGCDPYLHDDKPGCIPDNLAVFSRHKFPHSATPSPLHPSMHPE